MANEFKRIMTSLERRELSPPLKSVSESLFLRLVISSDGKVRLR